MERVCLPVLFSLALLLAGSSARVQASFLAPGPILADVPNQPAAGLFLVASRASHDPYFSGSVVYLLQYDAHGGFGVIVNYPTTVRLSDWLPGLQDTVLSSRELHNGGPVNPEILTILVENPAWPRTDETGLVFHVADAVFASNYPAVFDRLLQEQAIPSRRVRCYFGHIGWYAGQLEREINEHQWHVLPGDVDEVFGADTASLWQRLIERLEPVDLVLPPWIGNKGTDQNGSYLRHTVFTK
jgi:putative transcriptional regulator